MADKQAILGLAVPDLVNQLVNPYCVDDDGVVSTVAAIKNDPHLSDAQKSAMLEIYNGFTSGGDS